VLLAYWRIGRVEAEVPILMFKIELTQGLGWGSPALAVLQTMEPHLCDVEKFASEWLTEYQREYPESGASDYRILDTRGRRRKASTI
jgi:hypothetical protein